MISARTKAALAAAKRRGVKLGGDRGARLTAKARAAGRATLQERAQQGGGSCPNYQRATGGRL
jgi:DNA invertase Pin-like site-specific DNA recombinase